MALSATTRPMSRWSKRLAKSFGFRPLFFWQPTVFTKPCSCRSNAKRLENTPGPSRSSNDVYEHDTDLATTQGRRGIS